MQIMRVNACGGEEHVSGQLPLDAQDELFVVSLLYLPRELMRELCVQEGRSERGACRRNQRIAVPLAIAGHLIRERVDPNCSIQVVAEVDRRLVNAVLESAGVQPIPGEPAQQDSFGRQLVRESDTR